MTKRDAASGICDASGHSGDGEMQRPRLLIVEPEDLLRWSLTTYLGRWFDVVPVESTRAAAEVLEVHPFAAVVTSDELPDDELVHIETEARSRNRTTKLIRTVTNLASEGLPIADNYCIEKPFQLSKLAKMLGVLTTS